MHKEAIMSSRERIEALRQERKERAALDIWRRDMVIMTAILLGLIYFFVCMAIS